MPESNGFKACYRHPRRPAIKNCQYCERPICAECELESGDHRVCGPCKKKLVSATTAEAQPQAAPLGVGEVTVLRDGTVVGSDEAVGEAAEIPAAESFAVREVHPEAVREESASPPEAASADVPSEPEPAAGEEREEPGGPLRQLAYAAPFALVTALGVAGGWLVVAVVLEQWTQISVLTLGLAVPWVFYNSTVRKKRSGARVWTEAPVVLVSISSFTLVALTAPLLEFLVYKVVFSSFMKFDMFVSEYFNGLGWTLIALGLASALFIPFVLKLGSGRELPRLRLKRRRKLLDM